MADDIEYTFSGDAEDLIASLQDAANDATENLDKITESAKSTGEALDKDLGEGVDKAKEKMGELKEETVNIGEALDSIKEKFSTVFEAAGITAVYETLEKLVDVFDEAGEKAAALKTQSEVLGMSISQVQALNEAAAEADVAQGLLDRSLTRLYTTFDEAYNKGLPEAIDKLDKLGVNTAAVVNKSNPLPEIIQQIHERLEDSNTSEKEAAAIREVLGSRSASLISLFKEYSGTAEEVNAINEKMLNINAEQNESLEKFHKNVTIAKGEIHGLTNELLAFILGGTQTSEILYALVGPIGLMIIKYKQAQKALEEWGEGQGTLAEKAEAATAALEEKARQNLKTQLDVDKESLASAKSGTEVKVELARKVVEETEELYKTGGEVTSDAIKKAYQEAAKAVEEYTQKVFNDNKTLTDATVEAENKKALAVQATAQKQIEADVLMKSNDPIGYMQKEIAVDEAIEQANIKLYKSKEAALIDDGTNNKANAAQRIQLEAQVFVALEDFKQKKSALEKEFTEEVKKQALEQDQIRIQGIKQAEDVAVQQAQAQQKAAAAAGQEDKGLGAGAAIASAQAQIQAIGMVLTAQQDASAKTQAIYDQELKAETIDRETYAKLSSTLQTQEVAQVAAATTQIEQIYQKTTKQIGDDWKQAMTPIATGIQQTFDGVLKHTETLRQGMLKIFDGILQSWEKSMITVPLEQWAMRMGREVALKQVSATEQAAIDKESNAQGLLMAAETALKQRANAAATAAANTFSSVADDGPFGWIAAPFAAAAAFAAVMAFPIASAAGGMMVDDDQMAMVHENEMILPSDIRQGIEQKILQPQNNEQNTSTNNFSIAAMDAKSFEKFVNNPKNRLAVSNAVNKSRRRGNQNVRS